MRNIRQECLDAIHHRRISRKIAGKTYYYLGAYPLLNSDDIAAACRKAGFAARAYGTISKFDGRGMVTSFPVYVREREKRKGRKERSR